MFKALPTADFAVIKDIDRDYIVEAGEYSQMVDRANYLNRNYQSAAYQVQRWTDHRIY